MKFDLKEIKNIAKDRFVMNINGIHGIAHWERVRQNGLMIAKENEADKNIVELFAFLHDCCRENDGFDTNHGRRAAEFAKTLRGKYLFMDDKKFKLLYKACEYHADGRTKSDITVMTCWDADRLDLWRIGVRPKPDLLCTPHAKKRDVIDYCCQRIEKSRKEK